MQVRLTEPWRVLSLQLLDGWLANAASLKLDRYLPPSSSPWARMNHVKFVIITSHNRQQEGKGDARRQPRLTSIG